MGKDEVTGEQGFVDDERSGFWTWDDTECAWQSRPFKGRQVKKKKEREEESTKVYPKEAEEHSLAKNRDKIPNGGQKRTLLGGTKDAKARKDCQKAMMVLGRVVFALTSSTKVQARTFPKTKA